MTPASKLFRRLSQPTKRLSSKLRASEIKYQKNMSGLTMSKQPMGGLTDDQVQRFQRDGELSPSLHAGPQPKSESKPAGHSCLSVLPFIPTSPG